MKAELLSILRTTKDQAHFDEAKGALGILWDAEGTPQGIRDQILGSLPASCSKSSLKDVLVFDPLHERTPPAGFVKAVVAVAQDEELEDIALVAINVPADLPEDYVPVLSMRGCTIMSKPTFLDESEWR